MSWLHQISPAIRQTTEAMPPATGHGVAAPTYFQPLRVIYDHEVVLYAGSDFLVEIDGERLAVVPDSFVIFPPGHLHLEANVGDRVGYRWWCHFDWVDQGPYADTPLMTHHPAPPQPRRYRRAPAWLPAGILAGPVADPPHAYGLAREVDRMWRLGDAGERLAARGALLQLLLLLLAPGESIVHPRAAANPLAQQIRLRLDEAAADSAPPYLVDRLGGLGYSYEHLSRLFRREFGVPPQQYVRAQRLGRARLLLRSTRLTVAQIADAVGYPNASHFARLFRQDVGLTPTQWRRAGL